jgi:hypothetical protein
MVPCGVVVKVKVVEDVVEVDVLDVLVVVVVVMEVLVEVGQPRPSCRQQ